MSRAARAIALCALAAAALAACQTGIDPATGQSQTILTLPMTAGAQARAQQQWDQCVQFRSESYCEANLAFGRPSPSTLPPITWRPRPPDP